jgi:hypothetical protein
MAFNPNPLIRMAIKKCVAVRLGVVFDSRVTNRKQGGLPMRAPPPATFLLVALGSYMTPSWPEDTKKHHKQVETLSF